MVQTALARLRIGSKVMLIALLALAGFAAMLGVMLLTDHMQDQARADRAAAFLDYTRLRTIGEGFLEALRHEKDFLLSRDAEYAHLHAETIAALRSQIAGLAASAPGEMAAQLTSSRS